MKLDLTNTEQEKNFRYNKLPDFTLTLTLILTLISISGLKYLISSMNALESR